MTRYITVTGLLALLFMLMALAAPLKVQAQSYAAELAEISQFNVIDRYRHPDFERSADMLERNVLDSKNRIIGEVRNIILTRDGNVASIGVEFDRLRLRQEVSLDVLDLDIRSVSGGYRLAFRDDQVEEIYPDLLANIDTAAGSENLHSVKSIIGIALVAEDGRILGRVKDVIFHGQGRRAEALYVDLQMRGLRNDDPVNIPYSSAQVQERDGRLAAVISNAYADALVKYLDEL